MNNLRSKLLLSCVLTLALGMLASSGNAFGAEFLSVKNLNKNLVSTHAKWRAKDNWLNHLSRAELVRMMGARGVHPSPVAFSTQNYSAATPQVLDWRNHNGMDFIGPILNQGNCGSCVAFATIGTLQAQLNVTSGIAGLDPELSPQALFACGGGMCDYGWTPDLAAQFLVSTGVPDEACAPYTEGATGQDVSCSSICSNAAARSVKIANYTNPDGVDQVKAALANGPMVTTLLVYADFITYASGVYQHVTGDALGGHAVSLVGYDDAKQAWIIRNSWGPGWGDKGFAYISYNDVSGVGQENTQFVLDKAADYISSPIRDRQFVSGQTTFSATNHSTSQMVSNEGLKLAIQGQNQNSLSSSNCQTPTCSMALNTSTLPDGQYTLVANDGNATLYRYFYVANQAHQFDLEVTPQFDATQSVSGRIVFNIAINSESPVPLQQVALVVQGNGKTNTYWTNNITSEMTLGWRTPTVPNGQYVVWIRGQSYAAGHTTTFDSQKFTLNVQN